MDLIAEGIKKKLIRIEDGGKYIVYVDQDKRRNYANPEEKVQAESFLQLVLVYKYPPQPVQGPHRGQLSRKHQPLRHRP